MSSKTKALISLKIARSLSLFVSEIDITWYESIWPHNEVRNSYFFYNSTAQLYDCQEMCLDKKVREIYIRIVEIGFS